MRLRTTYFLSAKIAEKQDHNQKNEPSTRKKQNTEEKGKAANYRTNAYVKRPKPRISHLALPPGLGNEDRHATHPRQLENHLSCPCWIWGDTRRA